MTNLYQWWLRGDPQGCVARNPQSINVLVVCPNCGDPWAKCQSQSSAPREWRASHRRCVACGNGSLVGADWPNYPYQPYNLPRPLLLRELDLAAQNPETYDSPW
jgi:hypothetical protein